MKSLQTIISAGFLASALVLAGCGGGSEETTDEPPMTTPPTDSGPTALERAADAQIAADTARDTAEDLLKDAVDLADMLTAKDVNGDSRKAYMNALTVLNSRAAVETQRANAAAAVETLKGLSSTSDRIAGMLALAEADLEAIEKILEDKGPESLMEAIASVRGFSEKSSAELAQGVANTVASSMKSAIAALTSDSDSSAFSTGNAGAIATTGSSSNDIKYVGEPGRTFEHIAGMDVMSVKSLAGFTDISTPATPVVLASASALPSDLTAVAYKGIPGNLICIGDAASCTVSNGKVSGNLRFIADDADALYAPSGSGYAAVTNAASYGYWMNAEGVIQRNVRSFTTADLDWTNGPTATNEVSATYSGKAGGYSERTVGTGDAAKHGSGMFTADVTLKATFAETNTNTDLSGSISNFSGDEGHVNRNWYVNLTEATYGGSGSVVTGTVTDSEKVGKEDANSGAWNATAYGNAGKNPSGFVGVFNAAFADGSAAGVYEAD